MVIIHDHHIWWSYMMIRWSYMMIIYETEEMGYTPENDNLNVNYNVKLTCSPKPWNDPMASRIISIRQFPQHSEEIARQGRIAKYSIYECWFTCIIGELFLTYLPISPFIYIYVYLCVYIYIRLYTKIFAYIYTPMLPTSCLIMSVTSIPFVNPGTPGLDA